MAELEPSGFFAVRTPLLPIESWLAWTDPCVQATNAGPVDPASPLRSLAAEPAVADALYLASPTLAAAAQSEDPDRAQRALPKLTAYLSRASTRCTPFGLFAGCSVGRVGEATRLELAPRSRYQRHTRLDNDLLFALVAALEADPAVRRAVRWWPNSSLYRSGGRWRYAEARLDGTLRSYHLVAVEDFDGLSTVLAHTGRGATVAELAASLTGPDVTEQEAFDFVDELIDAQLLVSDLALQVTGPEPIDSLLDRLRPVPPAEPLAAALDAVRTALGKLDDAGPRATADDYSSVAALLAPLPVLPEPGRFLQVDMVKPTVEASLGPAVLDELARAVGFIRRIAPPRGDDELARFRGRFLERYDDRQVPLVEALDEESGIGFGSDPNEDSSSPLLAGLRFRPPPEEPGRWTARDRYLLARCATAVAGTAVGGVPVLELTDADIEALSDTAAPALPDALEMFATVAAASTAAVDEGSFRVVVHGVSGAPGVRLLGRFCHADEALHRHVLDHLRREEAARPDAVFAEVVHLPEGRIGNILCRPVLRDYEIPFLGRSGAAPDRQLLITDLLVSVVGDRVVLTSARLGREVVPRLTTAHNFASGTIGVYRFLCALQRQGTFEGRGWAWGPLAGAPVLPRVTRGRLVLARAQWTLRGEELAQLSRVGLPRLVALADGDNELACDLASPTSLDAVRAQLRGRTEATVVEMLPGPDELCVTGPEGQFVHEIVVPFVRAVPSVNRGRAPGTTGATIRRTFEPGSEWFYAKLYTGTGTADRVLTDAVRPFVDAALADGLADRWFFIRYGDPDWHVRLRLHGKPAPLLDLLHEVTAPLLADGRIWRVQLDTYQREMERYGGDAGMELSEQVFHADSEAVLAIVERLSGDEGLDARWRLALVGTDRLLGDLGLSLDEKVAWARARRDSFAREFQADARLAASVGARYRQERGSLEALLEASGVGDHPLAAGLALLERRSHAQVALGAALRTRGLDLGDLAASYAHMHANRLLRSGHRAQELVLHDLLYRLYQARLHRG